MKEINRILALDVATSTGISLWDRLLGVSSHHLTFIGDKGEPNTMRAHRFQSWLQIQLLYEPELVLVEMPHFQGSATQLLVLMAGIVEMECAKRGIPCVPLRSTTLKKQGAGTGKATKQEMVVAASKRFPHFLQKLKEHTKEHRLNTRKFLEDPRTLDELTKVFTDEADSLHALTIGIVRYLPETEWPFQWKEPK